MTAVDADRLVAHRGDQEYAAENSLDAFRRALDAGALWLECDVQLTRDAVPVLFHDPDMRRLCGVEGELCEFFFAKLPPLLAGPSIPMLSDLLALLSRYPKATLFLEIKTEIFPHYPIPEVVAELGGMIDGNAQVIPISFSAEALEYWWRNRRRQPLGWIGDEPERAPDIPLAYLFMSSDAFLQRGRPACAERLGVYTVNDAQSARQLLQNGADLLETDHFCRMQRLLSNG